MRNYKKESRWRDSKYIRFEGAVDRQEFEPTVKEITERYGKNEWLRRAFRLFQRKPELWEEEEE